MDQIHPHDTPDLEQAIQSAQYRMLATYMPHMYVAHIVSGLLIGLLFSTIASPAAVYLPMTLIMAMAIFRLSFWLSPYSSRSESIVTIRRTVHQAPFICAIFYVTLSLWIINLTWHADQPHQLLAAFFMAITTICGISFSANLPRCVYSIVITGAVPTLVSLISVANEAALIFAAIYAANLLVQVLVVRRSHEDFVGAVRLRIAAEASQHDAETARRDITRVANTDVLTGLPNRRALLATVTASIRDPGPAKPFALGLINIDGFKPINDLYGHSAGDEVICAVSDRIKATLGSRGYLAQLGGDEFGIVIEGSLDPAALQQLIHEIQAAIDAPIALDEGMAVISVCCGLALYPQMATTTTDLLQRAEEALTAAKQSGRGVTIIYNTELQTRQTRRTLIETRLRTAISERTFRLAFQPILDLKTRRTTSYEALARWDDLLLGPVSPGEFIPIAEQTGLITAVSEILFEQALSQAATWPQDMSLSFNLSPLQIHNTGFPLSILATLAEYRFPPERLLLEVTETALLTDVSRAAAVIEQLRDAGIRIAIDDFGVGYAGFGYLDKLTVDTLKIDRHFVNGMKDDKRKRQIVKAIVDMCHSLDIKCIAEGIEYEEELSILKAMGCDAGQGYFLGRPGPVASRLGAQIRALAAG